MLTIEEILEIMGTDPSEVIECDDGIVMTFGGKGEDAEATD